MMAIGMSVCATDVCVCVHHTESSLFPSASISVSAVSLLDTNILTACNVIVTSVMIAFNAVCSIGCSFGCHQRGTCSVEENIED